MFRKSKLIIQGNSKSMQLQDGAKGKIIPGLLILLREKKNL